MNKSRKIKSSKNKIRIYFFICVFVVSLATSILSVVFELSKNMQILIVIAEIVAVFAFYYYINLKWYRNILKQLDDLLPLLTTDVDTQQYRERITELLADKKSAQLQTAFCMGMCASYCVDKNWDKAKQSLLSAKSNKIFGIQKIAYWADMAYVGFYLSEDEEALKIVDQYRAKFMKFKDADRIGALISIVFIFELIAKKDIKNAKLLLTETESKWNEKSLEQDYSYIRHKIQSELI